MFCANLGAFFAPTPDPYYANVSLLLHADGTNGSTTFADNSPTPKTMTAFGNAKVSTASPKFGTGAAIFDGVGDYIETGNNNAFNFGSGDFTIEFWVRPVNNTGIQAHIGYANGFLTNANYEFQIVQNNADFQASVCIGLVQYDAVATSAVSTGVWTFIAGVRSGTNWTIYVNGVAANTVSVTGTLNNPAGSVLHIGQVQGLFDYDGQLDDIRITKGIARYTANFSPPTAPFPNS
jgi:hypothetical protein